MRIHQNMSLKLKSFVVFFKFQLNYNELSHSKEREIVVSLDRAVLRAIPPNLTLLMAEYA